MLAADGSRLELFSKTEPEAVLSRKQMEENTGMHMG